jgi:sulfur relay (sulfurtransferase) complex TusBCD TusD component (DsrE family)
MFLCVSCAKERGLISKDKLVFNGCAACRLIKWTAEFGIARLPPKLDIKSIT